MCSISNVSHMYTVQFPFLNNKFCSVCILSDCCSALIVCLGCIRIPLTFPWFSSLMANTVSTLLRYRGGLNCIWACRWRELWCWFVCSGHELSFPVFRQQLSQYLKVFKYARTVVLWRVALQLSKCGVWALLVCMGNICLHLLHTSIHYNCRCCLLLHRPMTKSLASWSKGRGVKDLEEEVAIQKQFIWCPTYLSYLVLNIPLPIPLFNARPQPLYMNCFGRQLQLRKDLVQLRPVALPRWGSSLFKASC